jgi:hypothetical protein
MKNYKLFQISYTVNFVFCLCVLGIASYRFISNWNSDKLNLYFFLFCLFIIVVFSTFDWVCYQLLYFIKTGSLLSAKLRIAGVIFSIICLLICFFCIFGFITIISGMIERRSLYSIDQYIFLCPFLGLVVTSIYLCISYWLLRKRLNLNFTNTIENFGGRD